jgi:uncharacterized membrane protein YebE (DUF533 family)
MDRKLKTATTTLGVLAGLAALGATVYAAKNKKEITKSIKGDMEGLWDRSALFLHTKIGTPIYDYIKRKENIPF